MSVVVIYSKFINETLNFVNECTHTYTYILIRRLIKFIAHVQVVLSNLCKA